MKNLATLLKKGDLTPKERVLLLVQNAVHKDKTGKEILTEADKHALSEGWRPTSNEQAKEYNHFNNGWVIEGSARLDAQTIYLNAQVSLLQSSRLVDYAMWMDYDKKGLGLFGRIRLGIKEADASELVLKNTGLLFDDFIYSYTFQSLSEDLRKDILALSPDAKTESQYLEQEEIMSDLFDGKERLTLEAKEKLAELIVDVPHNKYGKVFAEKGLGTGSWWFHGYFAELPTLEIAKRWADNIGISYDPESEKLGDELALAIQDYAEKNKLDVRELLKRTVHKWLDEGLFVKEYAPLCNSAGKSTCNNSDTKLPHREVMKKWLQAKGEARATVQKLTTEGKLKVEVREREFLGVRESVKIITGESICNLSDDFTFAEDFKRQIDNLIPLGFLVLFLRNGSFLKGYASLLTFSEIYKKLSSVYEIDLGYKIDGFINDFKVSIGQLNDELRFIAEKLEEKIYRENDTKFMAEVIMDDMFIKLEEIQPGKDETEVYYTKKFESILRHIY